MPQTTLYRTARQTFHNGDLALARNGGILGTNAATGHTHAYLLLWFGDVLEAFESREFRGARIVTLSSQVRKFPGRIDVFRPTCDGAVAQCAAEWAAKIAGHPYGYWDLWLAFSRRFGAYRGARGDTTIHFEDFHEPMDCSATATFCYRAGQKQVMHELGVLAPDAWDPCPLVNHRFVEPTMLASSGSFRLIAPGLVHGGDLRLMEQ